jgi:tetratricopeptide (TPR) repeat protein
VFRMASIFLLWSFFCASPAQAYFVPDCRDGMHIPTEAVGHCDEFISKHPDFALAYLDRAIAYVQAGDDNHALADLDKAIALHLTIPDRYYGSFVDNAYYHRGLLYNRRGDYRHALEDFSTLAKIGPIDYRAFLARGATYSEMGDHDAAIADFTRGIELTPKDTAGYQQRTGILKDMGLDAEANSDFIKAKELAEH